MKLSISAVVSLGIRVRLTLSRTSLRVIVVLLYTLNLLLAVKTHQKLCFATVYYCTQISQDKLPQRAAIIQAVAWYFSHSNPEYTYTCTSTYAEMFHWLL